MQLPAKILQGCLVLVASLTLPHAAILTVDDDPGADYTSIATALQNANLGDVIQVSCGIYYETFVMQDGVDVIGENADCTILDGTNLSPPPANFGPVVTFNSIKTVTRLSGFTIRNGVSQLGGGIYIEDSTSDATISHNIITGNSAVRDTLGYLGVGGGIEVYEAGPTISHNLFVGNTAERSGGAIDSYQAYPILINNTIVGNDAIGPGIAYGFGGGIYGGFSDVTVTSNVIYGNTSETGGAGIDLVQSTYTVEFNVLYLNSLLDWSCGGCANPLFPPPPGNIQTDPLFLGGVGSKAFCPRSHSPVIDAGAFVPPAATTDFFGRPRVLDGNYDNFAIVDQGFCETDEITMLTMELANLVAWDPSINGSAVYNLYRGDLDELRTSCATACVYSQDPMVVLEAAQECDLASPSFTDTDLPALGEGYYYLVTGEDSVEGGLGWLGGSSRSHDNPCP